MSARKGVGITSQYPAIEFIEGAPPQDWAKAVTDSLELVRDDIQRLAGLAEPTTNLVLTSGTYRAVMTVAGVARIMAISDTATAGSTGAAYHTLSATRNGTTPLTLRYDTRRTEVYAYRGGVYIGELTVSAGDVIAVAVAVTGAPAPTLTTANFLLSITLKAS